MKKVLIKSNTGFRIINESYWETIRKKLPESIISTMLSHDESIKLMELFGDSFNSKSIDIVLMKLDDIKDKFKINDDLFEFNIDKIFDDLL